jgi:hypothetical protein
MKTLVCWLLLCAAAVCARAEDVEVKNMTSREYQKRFDQLVSQGYRPVKVWADTLKVFDYQPGEGPSFGYWATFRKVANSPAWVARHGLDATAYQNEFNTWSGQGYVPTSMNVACVNGAVRYCVVYDKLANQPAGVARHNINKAQYDATHADLLSKGYKLKLRSSCKTPSGLVFVAFWQK